MKKRIFCLVIAIGLLISCLVSCKKAQNDKEQSPSDENPQTDLPAPTPDPTLPSGPDKDPENEPKPEPQPEPIFHKGSSTVIYGNIYYYTDQTARTLYQRDLTDPDDTGTPVWQGDGEDPFGGLGQSHFVIVDEIETKKEGAPVLVIAKSDLAGAQIFYYNTAKESLTELVNIDLGDFGMLENLWMYGDSIYYIPMITTENGDSFTECLHSVSKTTRKSTMLSYSGMTSMPPYLMAGADNRLYYYQFITESALYRATATLNKKEKLFELNQSPGIVYVDGGYLYYTEPDEPIVADTQKIGTVKLCRRSLDDLSGQAEVILEGMYGRDLAHAGNKIYFYLGSELHIHKQENSDYHRFTPTVLYVYDIATGESKPIFNQEKILYDSYSIKTCSENYVICEILEKIATEDEFFDIVASKILINVQTGEHHTLA